MRAVEAVRRSGIAVSPERTVEQVAVVMDRAGVGCVAVIDGDTLVGIVTDRDLVRRALAHGMALDARIVSVMSTPVVTIRADVDIHEAFALLRTHDVRRLAVLDEGRFVGVITVDDLLVSLASDLFALSRPLHSEILSPHRDNPVPATA
jgi:CBS domain-containing protein